MFYDNYTFVIITN